MVNVRNTNLGRASGRNGPFELSQLRREAPSLGRNMRPFFCHRTAHEENEQYQRQGKDRRDVKDVKVCQGRGLYAPRMFERPERHLLCQNGVARVQLKVSLALV